MHQLLHLVQGRLALLAIHLAGLLLEQRVELGVVAVGVDAALDHERLETGGGAAERAARALDDVLVGLLGVALEERDALERPQLGADADRL